MFHDIPDAMVARMQYLENLDSTDRLDGTPKAGRLRQIPRETGRLLAILAAEAPAGSIIEVGTSAGYSTMWLALGCAQRGLHVTTIEILPAKAELARQTFRSSGIAERVKLLQGDARDYLRQCGEIAFCFLDAEKEIYAECFELVVPRMLPGGLLVADNVVSHKDALADFLRMALSDARVDSIVVPLGKGLLISRRCWGPFTENGGLSG